MDRARPPDRGREAARERWAAPLVLAALLLAGCSTRTYLTPEVAGVVVAREGGMGGTARWELETGESYTLEMRSSDVIAGSGGSPNIGDLLLGGTGPDGPWVARLPKSTTQGVPADCYRLDGDGTDRGEWIETDAGFRLLKAPDFDPGLEEEREGERYTNALTPSFCVNPDGQVTSFG